jgi:hypothetical protein
MTAGLFEALLAGSTPSLFCAQTTSPRRQGAGAVAQQKFFDMWKLNRAESKMTHAGDADQSVAWRSYEPDGDQVRVSWGNDKGEVGSYSAKM